MADPEFPCAPCRRILGTKQAYDDHCKTPSHRQTLDTLRSASAVPTIPPGSVFCDACFAVVKEKDWARHLSTPQGGKGGLEVSPEEVDFGLVEVEELSEKSYGAQKVQELTIKAGTMPCVIARGEFAAGKKSAGQARFTVQDFASRSVYVAAGQSRKIPIHFLPRNVLGVHADTLSLTFHVANVNSHNSHGFDAADPSTYTCITIQRTIRGEVGSAADREMLSPTAPYVPKEERIFRAPRPDDSEVVRAPKGLAKQEFPENVPWTGKLPFYRPRPFLKKTIENQPIGLQITQLQEDIDLRNHDVEGATMRQGTVGGVWFLTVPGLVDRSPSVLKGDKIRIRISGQPNSRWFEGFVSVVHGTDIGLRFHQSFKPTASDTFAVQFTLSELHGDRSNELASWQLLSPDWFSPSIERNPEQRQAVLSTVNNTAGQVPFILYGPPGTGKTVTIVEACEQLVCYGHETRLLLTAPSNAAADLLVERLSGVLEPDEMFRLNAPSRQTAEVSAKVKEYSRIKDGSTFTCPPLETLKTFKVIISTCISASILAGVGLPRGHFSHIFVDDAGQATEPQTFLPLSLANDRTKVILAGDPHQLGPVIHSSVSSRFGLQTSLLERLMALPDYIETNHRARGITYVKLTKNYRNHPAILKLPNQLF
ncbi:RNA helicase [Rhodotorula toruloides]|uniref:RNA helicase n=1 Tax=Rhodotorula toruloides TaxID=5286 RepID=A0A511KL55_RHOTO|nr:RNA helicase [Rhodotorula toruloides]